jgi:hypothetical protein
MQKLSAGKVHSRHDQPFRARAPDYQRPARTARAVPQRLPCSEVYQFGLLVVRCPSAQLNARRGGTTQSVAPSVPVDVASPRRTTLTPSQRRAVAASRAGAAEHRQEHLDALARLHAGAVGFDVAPAEARHTGGRSWWPPATPPPGGPGCCGGKPEAQRQRRRRDSVCLDAARSHTLPSGIDGNAISRFLQVPAG